VAHGTVDEVVSAAGRRSSVTVRVADLAAAATVLRRADLPVERDGDALRVAIDPDDAQHVTRVLAAADLWVTELRPDRFSLEDVFLELTGAAPGIADGVRSDDELQEAMA
jgi:ABC-type uncharacterized transport system ATPase subunit